MFVHPLDAVGRIAPDARHIGVHKGKTLDWDFHPFIENMIATGSEDCSATVVQFPDGGTTSASENVCFFVCVFCFLFFYFFPFIFYFLGIAKFPISHIKCIKISNDIINGQCKYNLILCFWDKSMITILQNLKNNKTKRQHR